ncbi:MAG: helix-turn-helix domain-containing protein [Paracoccaceae bacterium]|nr:helix-turn-helix domain-containing protein [Paracoccaceae bacterium]
MMDASVEDPRQKAILKAAFDAFASYGFRRTSMEDISRGAGMSRPALYLHFKGKDEIFRALVAYYYDDAEQMVAEALGAPGAPAEVLARAFRAQSGQIGERILTSPHGHEILDAGMSAAGELVADGEARLTALYAEWMVRSGLRSRAEAQAMAEVMAMALKGVKAPPYETYLQRMDLLAQSFGAALTQS